MKNNPIATELETKLNEYWINHLSNNDNTYKQYAVLHKHEEGQIIDTTTSKFSSRLMSIRASKGDGREVVFILSCNERMLKLCSKGEINLIYESHLHVALTRAKNKIYFGLNKINDEIHNRFSKLGYIEHRPIIKTSLQNSTILKYINNETIIKLL